MTKDDLEKLVLKTKDPMKLAKAFHGMEEKQRKGLSTHAQSLLKQLEKNKANKSASVLLTKHINSRKGESWDFWHTQDTVNARITVIAVGPLTAVKSMHFYWQDEIWKVLGEIIVDRQPEWLEDWIEHDLAQEFSCLPFYRIWSWMKQGICKQPVHDGFYVRFAQYMMATGFYDQGPGMPISKALNAEPKLKEFVWSLFRVESDAFNTNSWFKKGAADDHETWTEALLKMSEAGDLDRQRLLDASLEGLWADLKQNQLSGFHKFHKALKPTPEERAARQSGYLSLLSHSVGHVVKFGLDNANALEKAKVLDAKTYLAEVPNVFFQDGKGNAAAAVKLMGRLLKSQPKKTKQILAVLPEALRHPNADVQKLALTILEKNAGDIDDAIRSQIADAADYVSASVRLQLAPYLEADSGEKNSQAEEVAQEIDIGDVSARQKKALRINELSKDGPFDYWPISANILDHYVLPGLEKLEPITDEDELIAAISHAVEVIDNPDDIERIIDGISRLAGKKSSDFKEKTAPLVHRIKKGDSEGSKGLQHYGIANKAVLDLCMTWLTDEFYDTEGEKIELKVGAFKPLVSHLKIIAKRVTKSSPRILLSFPSHSRGWIDPVDWVKRLLVLQNKNIEIDPIELSMSLLRLAPDNRSKALKLATEIKSSCGRIARFALGGEETPTAKDVKEYPIWISAARCRDPYRDWSQLFEVMGLYDNWPGSVLPAVHNWTPFVSTRSDSWGTFHTAKLQIDVKTNLNSETSGISTSTIGWEEIPSAALSQVSLNKNYWSTDLNSAWAMKWLYYLWPLHPNGAFISAAKQLTQRIDENSSNWDPNYGFLDGFFQPCRPWDEPAHLTLCVALAGKDADVRGLAIDAMIEGIEKGLLDIDVCAQILAKLSKGGWLKLNRVGDNLMTITETSTLHAWVISDLIQKWICNTDLKQRYIFRMFEVLLETHSTMGRSLAEETQKALKTLTGSNKATKVAKTLLKIKNVENPNLDVELRNLAISGRLN